MPQKVAVNQGWQDARMQQFGQWQLQNPDIEDRAGKLKAATAAMAAARGKTPHERWLRICAALAERAAAVSQTERTRLADVARVSAELAASKDWEAAAERYREILDVDPADVDANYGLGLCCRNLGDLPGASRHFSLAASFPMAGEGNGYFNSMLALQKLPPVADPAIFEPPVIFRTEAAPAEIWDAPLAPLMTIIPGGEYTMGSLESDARHVDTETPHRVTVGYPLAVGKYDVTRGEFAAFVADTGHGAESDGCSTFRNGRFTYDPKASWREPGFEQTDDEPVAGVNYFDGVAYAEWLSRITGHRYRLPSEAEWEYAVRGGTTTDYPWGDSLGIGHANCDGCTEGSLLHRPTRGGTFPPNRFGLYDVCGNVWKWMADCWNPDYVGAPDDGSAWDRGTTVLRGRRGGSWFNISEARAGDVRAPFRLRSAARFGSLPHIRIASFGLRVVRDL